MQLNFVTIEKIKEFFKHKPVLKKHFNIKIYHFHLNPFKYTSFKEFLLIF